MKGIVIAAGVIGLMLVGFLFVGSVAPVIIVAPEKVFTIGGLTVTNTMFTSWVTVILLSTIAYVAGRSVSLVPSGFAGAVEAAVSAFHGVVVSVAGEENGRRFFPLIATIFFVVVFNNYFGLLPINNVIGVPEPNHGENQVVFKQAEVPVLGDLAYVPLKPEQRNLKEGALPLMPEGASGHGAAIGTGGEAQVADLHVATDTAAAVASEGGAMEHSADRSFSGLLSPYFRSVNTDINAPLAIAIFSFIFVEFWGFQSLGIGYLGKFFAFSAIAKKGPMGLIDVFVGLLELVSELSRMVSFTFRLFGNIFAGEVLLLMMGFLVPFVLVDVFYGLELFVGLIQGFVFAMLTLVFAVTAVSHHGDGEHSEDHGEVAGAHH